MNDALIERIRKILARTTEAGCTTAESEAAYKLASRLMADHNLDMAAIQASGPEQVEESWHEEAVHDAGRWSSEFSMASDICYRFFFVRGYRSTRYVDGRFRECLIFFGTPTNVETARFILTSLLSAMDRLWKAHQRKTKCGRSERRYFTYHLVKGFGDKLQEERAATIKDRDDYNQTAGGTALALKTIEEKTELAYRAAHPDLAKSRSFSVSGSASTRAAGYQAGRNLNLSRGISGGGGPKAIGRG